MECHYCQRILREDPAYPASPAGFDLFSQTPRCQRHWRYVCDLCERPEHFQACGYCPEQASLFCRHCALMERTVEKAFWGWTYFFERRCPFCGGWHPSLDYREHQGEAPPLEAVSSEEHLERKRTRGFVALEQVDDEVVGRQWSQNAAAWIARCGPVGDVVRLVSDPVLFRLLGEVCGERVLDAGCGEGYLSRRLAGLGASVVGLELAEGLLRQARQVEQKSPLGIEYVSGSICSMDELSSHSFAAVVANNVMMYCSDVAAALSEFARVLKPGGRVVLVFTHPCFWGPGSDFVRRPPDTPRSEEWLEREVGHYGERRPHRFQQPGYAHPMTYFPRTLGDYFALFRAAGLAVTDLVEPWPDGVEGLPPGLRAQLGSLPISIAFRLEETGASG